MGMAKKLAFVLIPMMFLMYLLTVFLPDAGAVQGALIAMTVMFYVICLKDAGYTELILNLVFLTGGISLLVASGYPFSASLPGATTMVDLVMFILFVPLISSPIKKYLQVIQDVLTRLKQKMSPLTVSEYFTFIMSLMINLSSVPLNSRIFRADLPESAYPRLIALQNRAFALAILVTPVGAAITLTVSYTGVSYLQLVPVQLLVVSGAMILSRVMVKRDVLYETANEEVNGTFYKRELLAIFLPFLFFLVVLTVMEMQSVYGMMDIILMVVVPYSLVWSLVTGQLRQWKDDAKDQVKSVTKFFRQFSVILMAGWFIASLNLFLETSDVLDTLATVTQMLPLAVLMVLILSLMVGASLIGIHQFVVLVLLLEVFTSMEPFMPMPLLGSILMLGMVSGMLLSPYSGLNLMVQSTFPGFSSAGVAKLQWRFMAILLGGIVMVYALLSGLI